MTINDIVFDITLVLVSFQIGGMDLCLYSIKLRITMLIIIAQYSNNIKFDVHAIIILPSLRTVWHVILYRCNVHPPSPLTVA